MGKSNIKLFLQKPNSGKINYYFSSNDKTSSIEILIKGFDAEARRFGVTKVQIVDLKEIKAFVGELSLQKNKKSDISKENYLKLVEKTIQNVQEKQMDKVIISRSKSVDFDSSKISEFYASLCNSYQNAYCYLLILNQNEVWMGASPELLLKIKDEKVYTISLAGSKSSESIEWTDKEYEEQEMVTNYITDTLRNFCSNITYTGPTTVKTGKVYHLKTEIEAKLEKPDLAFDLIETLNPTPAVCGIPKKKAQAYILGNENYNRELYTGYIGVKNDKDIELFVNLRCAQLFVNSLKLYLGGGITAKSNAENEWEETELKSKTLLNKIP